MNYAVKLVRDDNGTILVDFPDFPEAHTFGVDEEDALRRAPEALATVIGAYIKARREIPDPPTHDRGLQVAVPPLVAAKAALYRAMRAQRVGKSELARRLGWHLPQVDRLLDVRHRSRLEHLSAAAATLGKRVVVMVDDLPTKRTRRLPVAVRRAERRPGTPRRAAR